MVLVATGKHDARAISARPAMIQQVIVSTRKLERFASRIASRQLTAYASYDLAKAHPESNSHVDIGSGTALTAPRGPCS